MDIENKVFKNIEECKKIPIISKAFSILDSLPLYLKYHTKKHTEDVFHESILFSILDNLKEEKFIEIAIAAAWHDVGYLVQPEDNEKEAVILFNKESKNTNTINKKNIKEMIMDTKIYITNEGPKIFITNPISAYLLDADVSNFGRKDFREKLDLVAKEKNVDLKNKKEKIEFLKFTLALLKNHSWYTQAAKELRQIQKIINIKNLENEISILDDKF